MRQAQHTCHVRSCRVSVPPRMLMCKRHWSMVPKHLRDAVWSTYRPGQEVDKRPTAEYLDAADEACRIVEKKERKRRAKQDHAKAQQSLFGGDS